MSICSLGPLNFILHSPFIDILENLSILRNQIKRNHKNIATITTKPNWLRQTLLHCFEQKSSVVNGYEYIGIAAFFAHF